MTLSRDVLAALYLVVCVCGCSDGSKAVALPISVNSIASGYPFALEVKNLIGKDAELTSVVVYFDRQNDHFEVRSLVYAFATTKVKRRLFAISVDNVTHEAFGLFDAPETPKNSRIPDFVFQPLDLRGIITEIFDALRVAETNGLAEFSSLAPGQKGNVSMHLGNSTKGPVWRVTGDGWDEKGPIADLSIVIDAKTGEVVSRTLARATNR